MTIPALASLPTEAPLVEVGPTGKPTEYLSRDWYLSLFARDQRLQAAPLILGTPTTLTSQSASIGATALSLGTLTGGLYAFLWYLRITQAATVSSSLALTIAWLESAVSLSSTSAAVTGNTITTTQSGLLVVRSDAVGPITYATTYASVGASVMKYRLDVLGVQLS